MAGHADTGKISRIADVLLRVGRHRRGAVALEFAFAGLSFLALVLFVVALGFRLYVQVALDFAGSRAARLLSVDNTQSLSGSATKFQTVTLCPLLASFLSCTNMTVSLHPVTDYRTGSAIGGTPPFNPGQGSSLMLLQIAYRLPVLTWPVPTSGGGKAALAGTVVTVGYPYQNEY